MNILDPREESSLKLYRWKKKICLFCLLFSVRDRRKYGWMIGITPLSLSLSCNFISRDYNTRINFSFVQ